jgi:Fe-S-cluster containining protein
MELTEGDIERISALGFEDFYIIVDGAKLLRNVDGRCYFLRGDDCIVYDSKPRGCSLYPLIMSVPSRDPMMDEDCPHRHLFRFDPEEIQELNELIDELEGA